MREENRRSFNAADYLLSGHSVFIAFRLHQKSPWPITCSTSSCSQSSSKLHRRSCSFPRLDTPPGRNRHKMGRCRTRNNLQLAVPARQRHRPVDCLFQRISICSIRKQGVREKHTGGCGCGSYSKNNRNQGQAHFSGLCDRLGMEVADNCLATQTGWIDGMMNQGRGVFQCRRELGFIYIHSCRTKALSLRCP